MKRSKFSEEQIAYTLRQLENGTTMPELARKLGVSEQTLYLWKKKYGGLRYSPKFGQGPKVDFGCLMRQIWGSTESSARS